MADGAWYRLHGYLYPVAPLPYRATNNRFNGNISRICWIGGQDAVFRTYIYAYDNANRITAAVFTSGTSAENSRYSLSGITYDANGNLRTMTRRGARTGSTYNVIDA